MEQKSLGGTIKAAIVGGLIAAVLTAGFHFVVTEPVIDRAIEMESSLAQVSEVLVNRDAQRAGLFLGFIMYGLTWGLLFSIVYHLARRRLPAMPASRRGFLLALLTAWSVSIFPFLKYPANPPGVGDPETIQYRQAMYVMFVALSAVSTLLAFALRDYLGSRRPAPRTRSLKWALVMALYVAAAAGLYMGMPANPDPIRMPAELVWTFRAFSLAGLAIFWAAFAGSFAWLIRPAGAMRQERRTAPARPPIT